MRPGGLMGPLGAPMGPRCAAGLREAHCTLVAVTSGSVSLRSLPRKIAQSRHKQPSSQGRTKENCASHSPAAQRKARQEYNALRASPAAQRGPMGAPWGAPWAPGPKIMISIGFFGQKGPGGIPQAPEEPGEKIQPDIAANGCTRCRFRPDLMFFRHSPTAVFGLKTSRRLSAHPGTPWDPPPTKK